MCSVHSHVPFKKRKCLSQYHAVGFILLSNDDCAESRCKIKKNSSSLLYKSWTLIKIYLGWGGQKRVFLYQIPHCQKIAGQKSLSILIITSKIKNCQPKLAPTKYFIRVGLCQRNWEWIRKQKNIREKHRNKYFCYSPRDTNSSSGTLSKYLRLFKDYTSLGVLNFSPSD